MVTIVNHPEFGYRDLTVHSIILFANHLMAAEVLKEMLSNASSVGSGYTLLESEANDVAKSARSFQADGGGDGQSDVEESTYAAQAAAFVATAKLVCGEGSESFETFRELKATACRGDTSSVCADKI